MILLAAPANDKVAIVVKRVTGFTLLNLKAMVMFTNRVSIHAVCCPLWFADADTSSLFHHVFMEESGSCEDSVGASATGRLPEYVSYFLVMADVSDMHLGF